MNEKYREKVGIAFDGEGEKKKKQEKGGVKKCTTVLRKGKTRKDLGLRWSSKEKWAFVFKERGKEET